MPMTCPRSDCRQSLTLDDHEQAPTRLACTSCAWAVEVLPGQHIPTLWDKRTHEPVESKVQPATLDSDPGNASGPVKRGPGRPRKNPPPADTAPAS